MKYARIEKILMKDGAQPVSFEKLLKEFDFITIHVPLTEETWNLTDKNQIEIMKYALHRNARRRAAVTVAEEVVKVLTNLAPKIHIFNPSFPI